MNVSDTFEQLYVRDNRIAYKALQELKELSEKTDLVYPYMDRLAAMLDSDSSYVRTRALTLIACNAKWDKNCRIDEIIDAYLEHITDVKPITARQCIKVLPLIAREKLDLRGKIIKALRNADVRIYGDSMRPLICEDISATLVKIEEMQ